MRGYLQAPVDRFELYGLHSESADQGILISAARRRVGRADGRESGRARKSAREQSERRGAVERTPRSFNCQARSCARRRSRNAVRLLSQENAFQTLRRLVPRAKMLLAHALLPIEAEEVVQRVVASLAGSPNECFESLFSDQRNVDEIIQ